jgi:hypothetical protein
MKKVAAYAEQVLNENYRRSVLKWEDSNPEYEPYSIAEWCDLESQSDPDFYRWLFCDVDINNFGSNLSDEEKEIATKYFENL